MDSQISGNTPVQFLARRAGISNGSLLVVMTILVAISIAAYGVYKIRGWKRPVTRFHGFATLSLTTTGNVITAALAADGKTFAYVTSDPGKETLWLSQVGSTSSTPVLSTAEDFQGVTFSPDRKTIYFSSSEGIRNKISAISSSGS